MTFDIPETEPNSELEKVYKTVGFIAVNWGMCEIALDSIIVLIFNNFKGHKFLDRRPSNLQQKLKLLRDCFKEFSEFKELQLESDTLFQSYENIGKRRNDIIHSLIDDYSQNDKFIFLKIDVIPKVRHKARSVVLSDLDWSILSKELQDLMKDSTRLLVKVFNKCSKNII
ncbi:MAG: hypothetical protein U1D41_01715 [Nitrosomonas sp.]|uniref:hypothetical protein n=1 Tax=Nitrosomonas sp. TaxID=42353 RepID=UPI002734DE50|nr:hypothetical protein [Nitrosomonas sp.]MDP3662393.1 hypothetical protein [Nitrosomonas sp.]MDZ4104876.1 hypothetical protein [Nitrosomonas sp.]